MHLHIGSNTPGYLPDGEIGCFGDIDTAANYLEDELKRIEEGYFECCPNGTIQPGTDQNCQCEWCDLAWDVYADRLHDGPTWPRLRTANAWSTTYRTPEGPDLHVWAEPAEGRHETCEVRLYQDS